MLNLSIPGYRELSLQNLVLDFNGTMAFDGNVSIKTRGILNELAGDFNTYILTADTFGSAVVQCAGINSEVIIIDPDLGGPAKEAFIEKIGASRTVAIGNGVNDVQMLARAALGIVVIGPEGCAGQALQQADVVVNNIDDALGLLLNPKRLIATLRR